MEVTDASVQNEQILSYAEPYQLFDGVEESANRGNAESK